MSIQHEIMKDLQVKAVIDPKEEIQNRVKFLKEYLLKTGAKGFVLGISGGQDSTLAGRLAQLAVEELRNEGKEAKFIAVRLPYKVQADDDDAMLALSFIQPDETVVFDVAHTVDAFENDYSTNMKQNLSDFNKGNVKARVRMIAQYAVGGMNNLLVIGTDHAAEAVTGFFTKYGDGGADLTPLTGLTKRQGRALLIELGATERLYLKAPTADLLDNKPLQTDETELGITYEAIDDYLEGKTVSGEIASKIEERYIKSKHKRHIPASLFDNWWK
ncbi:ammonia-dependent NAD(+) synthetase [Fredinandcohnia quinoae]|uniref:NH(3)-dependent NAD(+) synthetase n=1 Tax=Fredinandcohnia quinoae TaxID=2918902 RepID=A0AAW5EC03_9BACI|nr:ammonia-dependent NAD(+) synthetase [Fredinandcohnia sp. SECRCQ15]MCH1626703.1 ammonia-dependent NAD(+) synthetase [Fredinandcohnia sp. SECRCQ15]